MVDQIVKVRAQRSRHLGRGPGDVHLVSDLGYAALDLHTVAESVMASQPPHLSALMEGYAAGVNAWLDEHDRSRLPAWCADAAWIGRIETIDVCAYAVDLARAASSRNLIPYIALAQPPGPDGMVPPPPLPATLGGEMASNGWAVGKAKTASGHGIVVGNPHFPWYGEARFWENHLTIPGVLDVYGASLVGAPGIQIGFNRDIGWTHTFSIGKRFTLYRLDLVEGAPTRYRYGDGTREMQSRDVSVDVLEADGSLIRETRTLWWSHYGPMLNLPLLGWSEAFAFAFRDANEFGEHFVSQWIGMAMARSLEDFREVFREENGIPWVTTMAADAKGRTWYIDASHTPCLSEEGKRLYAEELAANPIAQLLDKSRAALLNGSDPRCEWSDPPGGLSRGLVPFESLPQLERDDWVANANESHWLTNPFEPLTGYPILMGSEGSPPSPRTRANLVALGGPGADSGVRLDADRLLERLLSNRSVLAGALCGEVVSRLSDSGTVEVSGESFDLREAAKILAGWDGTFDLDSRGAVLWREIVAGFSDEALCATGPLFGEPFSLDEPFTTPRRLAVAEEGMPDPLVDATVRAMVALRSAGIPFDARLGEVQWALFGTRRVPVHGGAETDGVANILVPNGLLPSSSLEPVPDPSAPIPGRTERTGLRVGGYQISYGTSFLMAVELTGEGPIARGLLAYGQSENPESPHHADQIDLFVAKQVRPMLFTDSDIASDPSLEVQVVSG